MPFALALKCGERVLRSDLVRCIVKSVELLFVVAGNAAGCRCRDGSRQGKSSRTIAWWAWVDMFQVVEVV
eukprot:1123391-Amphidinium_carterae.1